MAVWCLRKLGYVSYGKRMEKLNLVGSAENDGMRPEVAVVDEGLWEEAEEVGGSRGEARPSMAEAEFSTVLEDDVRTLALPFGVVEGDEILTL